MISVLMVCPVVAPGALPFNPAKLFCRHPLIHTSVNYWEAKIVTELPGEMARAARVCRVSGALIGKVGAGVHCCLLWEGCDSAFLETFSS